MGEAKPLELLAQKVQSLKAQKCTQEKFWAPKMCVILGLESRSLGQQNIFTAGKQYFTGISL